MLSTPQKMFLPVCAAILFAASGCLQTIALPVNILAYTKGQDTHKDLAYGSAEHQRLDVYRPSDIPASAALPVVIFFYGGGWSSGSKDEYRFVAEPFTTNGYAVVVADYGKYPEFLYPIFMNDASAVLGWTYRNISRYGGDPNRILLLGHSSGGHMAAMLATNKNFVENQNVPREVIRGCAGLAGPYDFVPDEQKYKEIFAPAGGNASSAMPATYLDGTQPPMLLIYGLEDTVVGITNLRSMERKAALYGGRLEIKLYEEVGHVALISAFALPLRGNNPVVEDVLSFFESLR